MAKANPIPTAAPTENSWFDFLTRLAFVIAVAVVVARVTFMDYSRARGSALAGFEVGAATPGGAGPGAALALDLLACVPAILILARRASDRAYIVRWSWSAAPLLGLAAWAALSVLWASDQFAAVVGAGQFVAAAALLWAASQLVRSWRRLRLIAAIAVGTLLAIAAHCVMFAALDRPTLQKYWTAYVCPEPGHQTGKDEREHPGECGKTHADGKPRQLVQRRELILRQRGLAPGDFGAKQFENKVFAPEQQGFYNSPNTLGAVVVLLLLITAGVVWQKVRDDGLTPRGGEGGTSPALAYTVFAVAALLAVAGAGWLLFQSRSKTALATIVLGAGLLVTAWRMRAWLAANARRAFWGAVVMIVVATAAVVGHGLYHKTLFHETLTFRWQYWTGAMGLVARHPIAGVGMDNFGEHYLSTRLPEAPEEVADPHNLLVKYAAELGLVGLLLGLAWLGRLAWELTRPVGPVLSPEPVAPSKAKAGAMPRASAIKVVSVIAGLAIAINVLANIDLATGTLDGGDLLLDGLRRAMMLAVILIGATAAAVRSLKAPDVDERPAPLV
ncbi:MAG: O-antigen ligase family protein, partial [Phycisphaerae bacterium]